MKNLKITQKVSYFKRWTRQKYAAFNSLHKLIVISFISLGCSFILKPVDGFSQTKPDTIITSLEEVSVTAEEERSINALQGILLKNRLSKSEIERSPVQSLNELLEYMHGIDVRQRGPYGTQADISYRGGNFDQTMILLNGINFSDPQTGHYSLNLPVTNDIISKIELYNNSTALLFGSSPFSGLINIITRPESVNSVTFHITAGMYGYLKNGISLNLLSGKFTHIIALDYNSADGYKENSGFDIVNGFYFGVGRFKYGDLEIQAGYNDKKYGANGFYSIKYPNQFESTKTFLSSIKWKHKGKVDWEPTLYYRLNDDCFELVKGQSPYKNNYHRNQVAGGNFVTSFRSIAGKSSFSADFRYENIISTSLGNLLDVPVPTNIYDIDFMKGRERIISGFSAAQNYLYGGFNAEMTLLLQHFNEYPKNLYFLPAGYLSYNFKSSQNKKINYLQKLYFTFGKALRMPTFTDLYYKTGDITGNENLLPEKSMTIELGYNLKLRKKGRGIPFFESDFAIFHRQGRDMIDYVKLDSETLWHTVNHTSVSFTGFEVAVKLLPPNMLNDNFFISNISVDYNYLYSNKESEGYQSRYLLDHLIHKLTFSISHRIIKKLEIDYHLSFQDRKGDFISYLPNSNGEMKTYPSYWLLDIRIHYTIKQFNLYVEASNVLNQKYYDFGDLEQPGIWIKAGVKCKIRM